MPLAIRRMPSPVGDLTLVADDIALVAVLWPDDRPGRVVVGPGDEVADHPVLDLAEQQLAAYFAGTLQHFTIKLDPRGTDFHKRVWAALPAIPFGTTCSYADIARRIGRPTAARAVGAANSRNPISIILPCHRLIGANGALTGFAGGLTAKAWLLNHERRTA